MSAIFFFLTSSFVRIHFFQSIQKKGGTIHNRIFPIPIQIKKKKKQKESYEHNMSITKPLHISWTIEWWEGTT